MNKKYVAGTLLVTSLLALGFSKAAPLKNRHIVCMTPMGPISEDASDKFDFKVSNNTVTIYVTTLTTQTKVTLSLANCFTIESN